MTQLACEGCGRRREVWASARDRAGGPTRRILGCRACGVAITWPVPGGVSAASTAIPASGPAWWVASRIVGSELAPVFRAVAAGGRVLDVGAGSGVRAAVLAEHGYRVTALEPDEDEARAARSRLGGLADVVASPIEHWSADGMRFDGAVASHVLEHVVDPSAALERIRDALTPVGRLVIFVPNAASREAQIFRGRWHGWEPSRHRWHWSARGLRDLLTNAGFGVDTVAAQGGWRYPATLVLSAVPGVDPQLRSGLGAPAGRALVMLGAPLSRTLSIGGRGPQLVAVATPSSA